MSDLANWLRTESNFHNSRKQSAAGDKYKEAADLIESQQTLIQEIESELRSHKQCIEGMQEERNALAANVELLRDGLNDAIEALVAETSESGSVKDAEIHDLRTLELSTPATSLNAVRRGVYADGFYDGYVAAWDADHSWQQDHNDYGLEQSEIEANQRYPDKE